MVCDPCKSCKQLIKYFILTLVMSYLDFADKLVERRLDKRLNASAEPADEHSRYVFLDELILQTTDKTKIRSELLNILLAGRDTTASLLSNVWFEMSKRPDIFNRLRKEVHDIVGKDKPSYQDLKDLKYLRSIINESQRLYPIVPSNARQSLVDAVMPRGGGPDGQAPVLIPKGSFVSWHLYSMHRRKDIYGEDADEFKPERWLDTENDGNPLRPGWGFLPFNGGPRICIGRKLRFLRKLDEPRD